MHARGLGFSCKVEHCREKKNIRYAGDRASNGAGVRDIEGAREKVPGHVKKMAKNDAKTNK